MFASDIAMAIHSAAAEAAPGNLQGDAPASSAPLAREGAPFGKSLAALGLGLLRAALGSADDAADAAAAEPPAPDLTVGLVEPTTAAEAEVTLAEVPEAPALVDAVGSETVEKTDAAEEAADEAAGISLDVTSMSMVDSGESGGRSPSSFATEDSEAAGGDAAGDASRKTRMTRMSGSTDSGGLSPMGLFEEESELDAFGCCSAVDEGEGTKGEGEEAALVPTVESETERILAKFLASSGGKNRAYFERLARSAAEAALKGYGMQHSTRIVRRTRTHKVTQRTDPRTNDVDRKVEETDKTEEWIEKGPAQMTGVGVLYARNRICSEQHADGTSKVISSNCRGKVGFWLGGETAETSEHKSYTFQYSGGAPCSPAELLQQAVPAP